MKEPQFTKISIVIVTWNSLEYVDDCFKSLASQTYENFSVIVVDNGSTDGTVEYIKKYFPRAYILRNMKNIGFAKANNQGIKIAKSEYVLIMNPDVVLEKDYLEKIITFAKENPQGATFGGKLYKMYQSYIDPSEDHGGMKEFKKSNLLDSTGLVISKNRKVVNRGEGMADDSRYAKNEKVFGITGACLLCRKEALEEIKMRDEYFDADFNTYKEEIDLAWRFLLYGWKNYYVPAAVGYHHRGFASTKIQTQLTKVKETKNARKHISKQLRYFSFRNQHFMLIKNEHATNIFFHFPYIAWYEVKLLTYALVFEPFLWRSVFEVFQKLPTMLMKRNYIMRHRKVTAKEMRKYFK